MFYRAEPSESGLCRTTESGFPRMVRKGNCPPVTKVLCSLSTA